MKADWILKTLIPEDWVIISTELENEANKNETEQ
jgi:hypothetical protein